MDYYKEDKYGQLYVNGYRRVFSFNNETEDRLKIKNGKFVRTLKGKHHFEKETKTEAFDKDGNFLCYHKEVERGVLDCEIEKLKPLGVVQIDYKFYLMPIGRCVTIDEVSMVENLLLKSGFIKQSKYYYELNKEDLINRDFSRYKTLEKENEIDIPYEINVSGYSRYVSSKIGSKIIDIDIDKYKSNLEKFILNNKEWEDEARFLFYLNTSLIGNYFKLTNEQVLKNKFCRKTAIINKINRKINRYETSK